jgi:exodeoxyribonuclease III
LKIATYNINGINGRLAVLLRWLKEAKPDVVCLQELKCPDKLFPESELLKAGYHSIWHGQKSWNGVAILAKEEIKETRRGLDGDPLDEHSRYIEGFVFGMVIGCLYLPNGNPAPGPKFDYKLKWFKRFTAHAKKLLSFDLPVLLIGDYNVIPTDLDTYKPEKYVTNALFFPESKLSYKKLLKQGWTDAIRTLYPTERIYTFYDYLRNAYERDAGLRLDHFLLNDVVAQRLVSASVDKHVRGWEKSSDHCPVCIEISET